MSSRQPSPVNISSDFVTACWNSSASAVFPAMAFLCVSAIMVPVVSLRCPRSAVEEDRILRIVESVACCMSCISSRLSTRLSSLPLLPLTSQGSTCPVSSRELSNLRLAHEGSPTELLHRTTASCRRRVSRSIENQILQDTHSEAQLLCGYCHCRWRCH